MDTYSFLREMADSWGLLFLVVFFLGSVIWAFRPGSRKEHADTANVVFRNETAVQDDADQTPEADK